MMTAEEVEVQAHQIEPGDLMPHPDTPCGPLKVRHVERQQESALVYLEDGSVLTFRATRTVFVRRPR